MIDTEALRKKVIDLAIQGKLTEQLPSDGDAETLYAKIQKEKAKLLKEGKIKKEKSLPEIKEDEIPFEIPRNWKWVRLASLYEINPRVEADDEIKAAFIPMEKISAGYSRDFTYDEQEWSSASKNHTKFQDDDVAFAKISPCFENRKSFIAKELPNGVGGGTTELIILRQKAILPEYTYYLITSQRFIDAGSMSYKGIVGQQRIKSEVVKSFLTPLPPLAEQKRIVAKIEEVMAQLDIIDDLQAKYTNNITVLKNKIIDAGIRGKLTEQLPSDGDAETLYAKIQKEKNKILKMRGGRQDKSIKTDDAVKPFKIPVNWKWIRFGEVGLFKKGPFGSALTKSTFVTKSSNTIKVYEQQHAIKKDATLGTYYISREYFENSMTGFEVQSGDILVSCAGTIGETYIVPPKIERGIINQALMRVTLVPSILNEFFLYYFDSNLKKNACNESNGMAIKNIPPFDVMKNWYFPLPPLAEQKRIVAKIDAILEQLN